MFVCLFYSGYRNTENGKNYHSSTLTLLETVTIVLWLNMLITLYVNVQILNVIYY